MLIINNEEYFDSRKEISNLLGGDMVKGIAVSKKYPIILLFANEDELYKDYFYSNTGGAVLSLHRYWKVWASR